MASAARKAAELMLTVTIYDATPVVCANEAASHRTVHVCLTPEQCAAVGLSGEYEGYSRVLIEPVANAEVLCG